MTTTMEEITDLDSLLHFQLKDLYSAETQLIEALPEIRKHVIGKDAHDAISEILDHTKEHKKRLGRIQKTLNMDLSGEKSKAMEGLIEKVRLFASENDQVQDAAIIAAVQRILHYQITAYGTALQFASARHYPQTADKLQQTLNEEKDADQELSIIAEGNLNPQPKNSE